MHNLQVIQKERVQTEDIGIYLRLIHMDYQIEDDAQLANLISEEFGVECTAQDIYIYNKLHVELEETQLIPKIKKQLTYLIG
jgi:hypothetical protein